MKRNNLVPQRGIGLAVADPLPPNLSSEEKTPFVPDSSVKVPDVDLRQNPEPERTGAESPINNVDRPVYDDSNSLRKFRSAESNPVQDTPPHLIENPTGPEKPTIVPSIKSLDSGFEPMLRDHLTQPVSDAHLRPPVIKRSDAGKTQILHEGS